MARAKLLHYHLLIDSSQSIKQSPWEEQRPATTAENRPIITSLRVTVLCVSIGSKVVGKMMRENKHSLLNEPTTAV